MNGTERTTRFMSRRRMAQSVRRPNAVYDEGARLPLHLGEGRRRFFCEHETGCRFLRTLNTAGLPFAMRQNDKMASPLAQIGTKGWESRTVAFQKQPQLCCLN